MDSDRLQPALYGGLLIGVLSALPIVNLGNCCCCLWVVAGGMLAVYLRQQNSPFVVTSAEGALVGLMAGLFGGILGVVLSIPIEMAMGPFQRQIVDWVVAQNPDFPPETRDMLEARRPGRRRRRRGGLQLRGLQRPGGRVRAPGRAPRRRRFQEEPAAGSAARDDGRAAARRVERVPNP